MRGRSWLYWAIGIVALIILVWVLFTYVIDIKG